MMQESVRVRFDDELPYSEQSLRRSCRRLYGHYYDTLRQKAAMCKRTLPRNFYMNNSNVQQVKQFCTALPPYAAREQEKERWVEPATSLHLPARRCASEIALNDNSVTYPIPSQAYPVEIPYDLRSLADERMHFRPPPHLRRRRSFSSLHPSNPEDTNYWRQAVVTSTKDYCTRRDQACRRTLSGHWPSLDETRFYDSSSFDSRNFVFHPTPHPDSVVHSQCNFCLQNELYNNWSGMSSGGFPVQPRDLPDEIIFRAQRFPNHQMSLPNDALLDDRISPTDYSHSNNNSHLNSLTDYGNKDVFQTQKTPPANTHETLNDNINLDDIEQNTKVFGTIRQFQDPFLLAKFSNLTKVIPDKKNSPGQKIVENSEDETSHKDISNDETESCPSVQEESKEVKQKKVIGRREERMTTGQNSISIGQRNIMINGNTMTNGKLIYKSDSAINVVRKDSRRLSLFQKACLAAKSMKQTLRRAFSQDHIKMKCDRIGSIRKNTLKSKNDANNKHDIEINVSGQLLKIHDDGSILVELGKHSAGSIGFFVAQGKLKNHKGIFVCRMMNITVRSHLTGLVEIGDEILKLDGNEVTTDEASKVNSTLAAKSVVSLTILPYTYRNELVTK